LGDIDIDRNIVVNTEFKEEAVENVNNTEAK
jgi:hypothetical protein